MLTNDDCTYLNGWKKSAFEHFHDTLLNKEKKFPCIFGSMGMAKKMLRFSFFENTSNTELHRLKNDLYEYINVCKKIGDYTSYLKYSQNTV